MSVGNHHARGWYDGKGTPAGPSKPVHGRLYRCAQCGEVLSSPSRFYTCPIGNRGYIPTHELPKVRI